MANYLLSIMARGVYDRRGPRLLGALFFRGVFFFLGGGVVENFGLLSAGFAMNVRWVVLNITLKEAEKTMDSPIPFC